MRTFLGSVLCLSLLAGCGESDEAEPRVLDPLHNFELELQADVISCEPGVGHVARNWILVGSVDLGTEPATGWFALNGIRGEDGEIARYTLGSRDFVGAVDGTTLSVESAGIPYEDNGIPSDTLEFSVELAFHDDESIDGHAEGIWSWAEANRRCDHTFTATISGGPDRNAPRAVAWQDDSSPLFPFEPITGYLTEPIASESVSVAVEAGGQPLAASLSFVDDQFGRPREFLVTPAGTWPAGTNLQATLVGLADASGNSLATVLGPFAIPGIPNTAANPGFEDGLSNWLTDPVSTGIGIPPINAIHGILVQDEQGETFLVEAPEGELMALIDFAGMRLIGHFEPGPSVTRVVMTVGVLDPNPHLLKADGAGFRISVFQNGALTLLGDGTALPDELPDSRGSFSGFVELDLPLPDGPDRQTWLLIEASGFMPPVHLPSLLVDDIRFE